MSTTRSKRDYKLVSVERRERIGAGKHMWSCAIKHQGQIRWFHDTSPLAVMKLAVQACRDTVARQIATELRGKKSSALEDWLR